MKLRKEEDQVMLEYQKMEKTGRFLLIMESLKNTLEHSAVKNKQRSHMIFTRYDSI